LRTVLPLDEPMKISRRTFLATGLTSAVGAALGGYAIYRIATSVQPERSPGMSEVFMVSASNRVESIKKLLGRFDLSGFKHARVALKANYNSADPFPASTHIDTLRALVEGLQAAGAGQFFLAERSGMGDTRRVLEATGVIQLANELGLEVIVLDELPADGWMDIKPEGLHWARGFRLPRLLTEAQKVVQTCCLKTHRFGGHFTMSLKNSVGLVAKRDPDGFYDYMAELHTSPFQRLMIAEISRFYNVDLVLMDATEGFVRGGPDQGDLVKPNLILASQDRVAIDAVGVALLRSYGSTPEVMTGRIFELEQISRAAELGVGVSSASSITLVPLDGESEAIARTIHDILETQG
jgi:uncharacterized protein (DUF362 family)